MVNQEVFLDRSAPDPTPIAGQALIRPTKVLVGPADISACTGAIAHEGILGYQFVGVVESCDDPDSNESWNGARVVGHVNISDPSSELARRGLANHDPDRMVLGLRGRDGCLAERFVLETRNLTRVPDEIEDERAVFALSLAAAVHASQIVHIEGKPLRHRARAGRIRALVRTGDDQAQCFCPLAGDQRPAS